MADPVLFLCIQFGKADRMAVRHKDRIITETAVTGWFRRNSSAAAAIKQNLIATRPD